ncbi:hypothetical protein ACSNOK_00345 [Streptomyces sp. URMC 126]|uniref:hypothetical protein n=1 Tax=Streptomyces sp. URMC 126 TaxID=3423401 RepID=UPI003F19FBF5
MRLVAVLSMVALTTTGIAVAAQHDSGGRPREAARRQAAEFVHVHATTTIPPGQFRTVDVTCPAGRTVTGGGWTAQGGSEAQFVVGQSYPLDRSWNVDGRNTGTADAIVSVDAICAVGGP